MGNCLAPLLLLVGLNSALSAVQGHTLARTRGGCRCVPWSAEAGGVRFEGCENHGWCDVELGCAAARDAAASYGGWDECEPAGLMAKAWSMIARPAVVPIKFRALYSGQARSATTDAELELVRELLLEALEAPGTAGRTPGEREPSSTRKNVPQLSSSREKSVLGSPTKEAEFQRARYARWLQRRCPTVQCSRQRDRELVAALVRLCGPARVGDVSDCNTPLEQTVDREVQQSRRRLLQEGVAVEGEDESESEAQGAYYVDAVCGSDVEPWSAKSHSSPFASPKAALQAARRFAEGIGKSVVLLRVGQSHAISEAVASLATGAHSFHRDVLP